MRGEEMGWESIGGTFIHKRVMQCKDFNLNLEKVETPQVIQDLDSREVESESLSCVPWQRR